MKKFECPSCGGDLEMYHDNYYCHNCEGIYQSQQIESDTAEPITINEEVTGNKNGVIKNVIITLILVVVCVIGMFLFKTFLSAIDGLSDKTATSYQTGENNTSTPNQPSTEPKESVYVPRNIDRFSNINVNENGDRYFDMTFRDFAYNYNYFIAAEYGEDSSYNKIDDELSMLAGQYTNDDGTELEGSWFTSMLTGQRIYVYKFERTELIYDVIYKIDDNVYKNMSIDEKNIIKEQVKIICMALLPEIDEAFYENNIWSVLKKSIIDGEEDAIAIIGQVCFYTYTSDDNKRCIYIYPKKGLEYQQPEDALPLSETIIGKWQNTDGSIWEYKTDGTFTIDFSTYRPEDTSAEADYLRGTDIIRVPYSIAGDYVVFKMGNASYKNHVRIENGFKYEIESVGNTHSTMKRVA